MVERAVEQGADLPALVEENKEGQLLAAGAPAAEDRPGAFEQSPLSEEELLQIVNAVAANPARQMD